MNDSGRLANLEKINSHGANYSLYTRNLFDGVDEVAARDGRDGRDSSREAWSDKSSPRIQSRAACLIATRCYARVASRIRDGVAAVSEPQHGEYARACQIKLMYCQLP